MRSSLDVLAKANGRTVAVLGDMGELGEDERKLHYEVGEYAAKHNIDLLICVGTLCEDMKNGAESVANTNTKVMHFETRESLLENIHELVEEGDTILVKASHFMKFEQVVDELKK